jgi:murein lipoprotein
MVVLYLQKRYTFFSRRPITHVGNSCQARQTVAAAVGVRQTEQEGGDYIMKKGLLMISMVMALSIAVGGCATRGDLEQVQAQEKMIGAKADQAAQDAQAAKAAAEAATLRANEAAARAEEAVRRAEERERIADEKAKQADILFKKSMKK